MAKATNNRKQQREERRAARRKGNIKYQGNLITLPPVEQFSPEKHELLMEFKARNPAQEQYAMLIKNNTVTFGYGSAGTGKSFVGIALAALDIRELKKKRLIITRPIVEAKGGGAGLGFLPGTVEQKVDPYLKPVKEILAKFFTPGHLEYLFSHDVAEFATLEHMRGRTFDDSYIIVDEAQNATVEQMKLVLTRIGRNTKVVINGDTRQTDLTGQKHVSGLIDAIRRFHGKEGFASHLFTPKDVVRHDIVQTVIEAYETD
ncbi:MAG TPA: PhoH family protein [Dongiaceae bacterium]|nr:PhoH family protein [Dongiaceae bacterium]